MAKSATAIAGKPPSATAAFCFFLFETAAVVKYGRNNGKYILLFLKANVVVPAAKTEPAGSDSSGENEQETPPKIPEETPGSQN